MATWQNEKFVSRRKTRRSSPTEQDDPLGLHVEERDSGKISEEQLQILYPEASGKKKKLYLMYLMICIFIWA